MKVMSDGVDIHYEVSGKGPDVVLLHPFPSNHDFWRPVIERLESKYRVITPDLRGLGESESGDGPVTMAQHAIDLERICVDAGVAKAIFVGCSIGGYLLFEYWRRFRARFRALVLCDTKAEADDDAAKQTRERAAEEVMLRGPELFLQLTLPKLVGSTTQRNRPDVFAAARATCLRATAKGIAAVQRGMAVRPDSTKTLATIDVPTLVICGDEDVPTPPAVMQAMSKNIAGSRFEVIPAAGHFAALERPEEFVRILRQFLESLPSS